MEGQKSRNNYYAKYFNTPFPKKWFNRCHGKLFDFTELVVLHPESVQRSNSWFKEGFTTERAQLNDANSKSDPY